MDAAEFYKVSKGCIVTGDSPETTFMHRRITVKTTTDEFLTYIGEELYYEVGDTIK